MSQLSVSDHYHHSLFPKIACLACLHSQLWIESANAQNIQIKHQNQQLMIEIEQLKNQNQQQQLIICEKEEQIALLNSELNTSGAILNNTKTLLDAKEEQIVKLNDQLDKLGNQIDEKDSTIREFEKQLKLLEISSQSKTKSLNKLTKILETHRKSISDQSEQINQLQTQIELFQNIDSEKNQLKQLNVTLLHKVKELTEDKDQRGKQIAQLLTKINLLKKKESELLYYESSSPPIPSVKSATSVGHSGEFVVEYEKLYDKPEGIPNIRLLDAKPVEQQLDEFSVLLQLLNAECGTYHTIARYIEVFGAINSLDYSKFYSSAFENIMAMFDPKTDASWIFSILKGIDFAKGERPGITTRSKKKPSKEQLIDYLSRFQRYIQILVTLLIVQISASLIYSFRSKLPTFVYIFEKLSFSIDDKLPEYLVRNSQDFKFHVAYLVNKIAILIQHQTNTIISSELKAKWNNSLISCFATHSALAENPENHSNVTADCVFSFEAKKGDMRSFRVFMIARGMGFWDSEDNKKTKSCCKITEK